MKKRLFAFPSPTEMHLLSTVWNAPTPLIGAEVVKHSKRPEINSNTVYVTLKRLVKKGWLVRDDMTYRASYKGAVLARAAHEITLIK